MKTKDFDEHLKNGDIVEAVDQKVEKQISQKNPKALLDLYTDLGEFTHVSEEILSGNYDKQIDELLYDKDYPNIILNKIARMNCFIVPDAGDIQLDVQACKSKYLEFKGKFKCFEEYLGYNALYVFFSALSYETTDYEPSLDEIAYGEHSESFFLWLHKFLDVDSSHKDHFRDVSLEKTDVLTDTIINNLQRWSGMKVTDEEGVTIKEFEKEDSPQEFSLYKYCENIAESLA